MQIYTRIDERYDTIIKYLRERGRIIVFMPSKRGSYNNFKQQTERFAKIHNVGKIDVVTEKVYNELNPNNIQGLEIQNHCLKYKIQNPLLIRKIDEDIYEYNIKTSTSLEILHNNIFEKINIYFEVPNKHRINEEFAKLGIDTKLVTFIVPEKHNSAYKGIYLDVPDGFERVSIQLLPPLYKANVCHIPQASQMRSDMLLPMTEYLPQD